MTQISYYSKQKTTTVQSRPRHSSSVIIANYASPQKYSNIQKRQGAQNKRSLGTVDSLKSEGSPFDPSKFEPYSSKKSRKKFIPIKCWLQRDFFAWEHDQNCKCTLFLSQLPQRKTSVNTNS